MQHHSANGEIKFTHYMVLSYFVNVKENITKTRINTRITQQNIGICPKILTQTSLTKWDKQKVQTQIRLLKEQSAQGLHPHP